MANTIKDQLIRFRCKCGKKLKAAPEIIGRKVKCTQCSRVNRVPESDQLGDRPKSPPASAKKKSKRTKRSKLPTQALASERKPAITAKIIRPPLVFDNRADESLLPKPDGSDPRFKLDPSQAPEPSNEIVGSESNGASDFDFNIDSIVIDSAPAPVVTTSDSRQLKPAAVHSNGQSKRWDLRKQITKRTMAIAAGGMAIAFLVVVAICVASLGSGYPAEFSQRPEVVQYINAIQKFRKSKNEYSLMSEAYVKSKAPGEQEILEIDSFKHEIEPLDAQDETLTAALNYFKAFQPERARETLVSATKNLNDKTPEVQAKARNYSSRLR